MYLLKRIEVWARNRLNRVVKTSKLQFVDSGLLASLLDLNAEEVHQDHTRFGNVLETFVYGELLKHNTSTADGDYHLMYYRDADKFEVDIVIESAAGQLAGVEVKPAATVKENDLRGLKNGSDGKQKHQRRRRPVGAGSTGYYVQLASFRPGTLPKCF